MPAPTALDNAQTGTPDTSLGTKLATIVSAESTQIEVPGGITMTDHIASALGTHRSAVTGADSCYINLQDFGSTPTSAELINNHGALAVWAQFVSSSGRMTVSPLFYDNQTTPYPTTFGPQIGLAPVGFQATTTSGGKFLTRIQLVDTYGFRRFKIFVDAMTNSTGGVDIYAVPV